MKKVRDVLNVKGHSVFSIHPEASVYEAIELMAEKEIGALLVTEADKLIGIVSERDYARKIILQGRASKTTAVKEIMTSRVAYTEPERDIEECMALMTDKRIRHLPVIEGGKVCGIVSIGDLVKAIIDEQQFIIQQLERYIAL